MENIMLLQTGLLKKQTATAAATILQLLPLLNNGGCLWIIMLAKGLTEDMKFRK